MRSWTQLVPLAITVAVIGGITWLLLDRDVVLGRWLLGALILGHGLAHIAFVVPRPEPASARAGQMEWPFDLGRSWLVGRFGVDPSIVRVAGRVLTAITIVTALLAALATAGILIPAAWWSGLVVALAISSALLLALMQAPGARPAGERTSVRKELAEGLRYVASVPWLRSAGSASSPGPSSALAQAVELAEPGFEDRLQAGDQAIPVGGARVQLRQVGAGPEAVLELLGAAVRDLVGARLAEDDHPAHHRGHQRCSHARGSAGTTRATARTPRPSRS